MMTASRRAAVTRGQGWALALAHYTSSEDVVFGATVAGRPVALDGVDAMLGLFINTIPARIRWNSPTNRSIATAASTNGNASPIEYAPSSITPRDTSASDAAYVRMAPRIGPMHGVHPAPNATPA